MDVLVDLFKTKNLRRLDIKGAGFQRVVLNPCRRCGDEGCGHCLVNSKNWPLEELAQAKPMQDLFPEEWSAEPLKGEEDSAERTFVQSSDAIFGCFSQFGRDAASNSSGPAVHGGFWRQQPNEPRSLRPAVSTPARHR